MNKRREANRHESERNSGGDAGGANSGHIRAPSQHDYGRGHTMTKAHGSHASRGQIMGPGPVEGAGEVGGTGPGKAASRYMGLPDHDNAPQEPASGKTPAGESTYNEE